MLTALRTVCGPGRTPVLVVDDAHLLDGPSAAVLLGLVQARAVRALVTARSGFRPRTPWSRCGRTSGYPG
ncbi:hypothetical protein NKG94_21285 [Micromonospora sp. M12]